MLIADWGRRPSARVSDVAEAVLLGTCLVVPSERRLPSSLGLARRDFRSPHRGHVWEAIQSLPEESVDAVTVTSWLEARHLAPPRGLTWLMAVVGLLDETCPDEEQMTAYTQIVKEAATRRALRVVKSEAD